MCMYTCTSYVERYNGSLYVVCADCRVPTAE
jgi:hypothetical protein